MVPKLPEPTLLDDLVIIGYADALTVDALPRIVTPVFRHRTEKDRILLPPFRLYDNFVFGGAWDSINRWQSLIKTGNMTELVETITAQGDHQLWIDQNNQPRYELRSTAHKNLETIAAEKVNEAQEALAHGSLDIADQLATTAFNADDRNIEALILKAAVRRLEGKSRNISFFASLAHGIEPEHFSILVANLLGEEMPKLKSSVDNIPRKKRTDAVGQIQAEPDKTTFFISHREAITLEVLSVIMSSLLRGKISNARSPDSNISRMKRGDDKRELLANDILAYNRERNVA